MADNDKTRVEIVIEHIEDVKEHRGEEAYNQMESKCLQDISVSAAKLVDSYTNLKSAKAPIITESISTPADVQTFSDGADGMPIKTLTVGIEPVQDLHGYDNPWPGGGNKNLFDPTPYAGLSYGASVGTSVSLTSGDPVTVSGNSISYVISSWGYRNFKSPPLSAGTYHIYVDVSAITNPRFTIYVVGSDNVIKEMYNTDVTIHASKTLVDGDYIVIYAGSNTAQTLTFTNWQIESGSSYTSWVPYSNICPITGHTGANVSRTGKNLCGGSELKSKLQTITGATTGTDTVGDYVTFAGSSAMSGIPLFDKFKANTQYTAILKYKKNNTNTASNIAFLYSDGTFGYINSQETAAEGALYTAVITSTSGKTITDIRAIYASGDTTVYYNLCGVFEGVLTADQFAPYTGNTYAYTFPTPPGTVYGGTLTIHQDGTGTLVVDMVEVDLGTLTWAGWYETDSNIFNASLPGKTQQRAKSDCISSMYKYRSAVELWSQLLNGEMTGNANNDRIYMRNHAYNNTESFKAGMNGVQLVYTLATPVTYQLTNQQVIELLKGSNNIWADTGKINAVEYPADTKLYIDGKVAELQALILENISNS